MALSLPSKPTYIYNNYAKELKQRLRATQQVAKSHINKAKIKAKIYTDKDTNTKTFKIRDKDVTMHLSGQRSIVTTRHTAR